MKRSGKTPSGIPARHPSTACPPGQSAGSDPSRNLMLMHVLFKISNASPLPLRRSFPEQQDVRVVIRQGRSEALLRRHGSDSCRSPCNERSQINAVHLPVIRRRVDHMQLLARPELETHRHHHARREQRGEQITLLPPSRLPFSSSSNRGVSWLSGKADGRRRLADEIVLLDQPPSRAYPTTWNC